MSTPWQVGLDRRAAWWTVLGSSAVLVVVGALLVPWDWVPGGDVASVSAEDVFSDGQVARAESYSSAVRWLSVSSYAVSLLVAVLLGFTPVGSGVVHRMALRLRWWVTVPVVALALLLIGRLATLPFALLLRDRRLEEGLTRQALGGWLLDQGLALVVGWLATSLLLLVLVGFARRWPRRWFVGAGVAGATLVFAFSLIYPVVVEPLFNDFEPFPAGRLRDSLVDVAEDQGVTVGDVLVADASRRTTTLNAYVSGLWETRRIVVYDTLLRDAPPEEVRAVVAHEVAHARHRDVLLGTTLGAVGVLGGIALLALLLDSPPARRPRRASGPQDPRVVPTLLAVVALAGLATAPVQSAVSRAIEARADRDAVAATSDPAAFSSLQRRLALRARADPTPPTWSYVLFASHPTVLQRLGIAEAVAQDDR